MVTVSPHPGGLDAIFGAALGLLVYGMSHDDRLTDAVFKHAREGDHILTKLIVDTPEHPRFAMVDVMRANVLATWLFCRQIGRAVADPFLMALVQTRE